MARFRDLLLQQGTIDRDSVFVANHFSHNGGALQAELEAFYTPRGIVTGYDGLTLEL